MTTMTERREHTVSFEAALRPDSGASMFAESSAGNGHVAFPGMMPDVCGLVGRAPRAIYIMLPVEPGDEIDTGLAGPGYPAKDGTAPDDGWAVISGTSAASPQVAGVCALLKQAQPGLSPDLVKAVLTASARDVVDGESAMGQVAGDGYDGPTGAGLVNAEAAYRLARSVTPRNLNTLPPPR
ncbi:S8 family serine peptidase [[Actinomadura] parvosata]|uniref:S8 family serine peptidase n=1 Tax=[Actinomadura] parvosata TaxID=1955412 RepID=UPI00406C1B04